MNEIKRVFIHDPLAWDSDIATDLVVVELARIPSDVDLKNLPIYEERFQGEDFLSKKSCVVKKKGSLVSERTASGLVTGNDVVRISLNNGLFYYSTCNNKGSETSAKPGDSGSLVFISNKRYRDKLHQPLGTVYGTNKSGTCLFVTPLVPLEELIAFKPMTDICHLTTSVDEYVSTEKPTETWTVGNCDPKKSTGVGVFHRLDRISLPTPKVAAKKFSRHQFVRYGLLLNGGGHDWKHLYIGVS